MMLAVLPGFILGFMVYRMDKLEKEPLSLLLKLFFFGALSIIPALILEVVGSIILELFLANSFLFQLSMNFIVIACAEEGSKLFFLKLGSWKHPAFNYRFDAIVYAVSVGLGFAIFENIGYVIPNGFVVAIMRALTAVPAHTIFAIFMGHYFGEAKLQDRLGNPPGRSINMILAFLVPVFLHGLYDFIASSSNGLLALGFWVLLIVLDVIAIRKIRKYSAEDVEL